MGGRALVPVPTTAVAQTREVSMEENENIVRNQVAKCLAVKTLKYTILGVY